MNTFLIIVDAILLAIILAFAAVWGWNKIQAKSIGGELSNDDFKTGMRKAQIIDLREKEAFKRKHIDGARNLPYSMLKYQFGELRSDLPVYLYSDSQTITLRAARVLKKKGFANIKWLKDGFDRWDGRTKASKY
ncbi:rhodanese-like domain-containing protein [Lactobacillus gigeriorum]|uniref:Rhodanese-related sulfurtransferase n=1 Tax=Lactobacillus gigeriorum DSM 23908 = CRBIP 24.85 TaxID=1423751 RepID=I7J169_9LACO|nr:rhodanese-like domain-containing protein [Lactobacillus gigeriorum]KRN14133.1 rhodanese-related sulfurtransferase [Lactobacillus gigeriorum DSM 23908 = CRBIP 24.85]CCI86132.1 Rhodanese-related sulfurtransferase [Lactobacillus gigeriorum DSM 23908 = CRBIP 24.85]